MPRNEYYLPSRQLVSQDDAAMIESATIPRSRFTGSWTRKTSFDAGFLVPILVDEILPGDHMSYDITAYVRMSTPLFPIFDNQRIDTFFFFVPNRLLWDNWAKFMGEQANPLDSIDYTIPQVEMPETEEPGQNELFDHMGIPVLGQLVTPPESFFVNALPFRAYNRIWNEWFRDQNLQLSISQLTGDGPDSQGVYALRRRNKSHDYFTSALPFAQKFTAPNVPLAGIAPIFGIGAVPGSVSSVSTAVTDTRGQAQSYPFFRDFADGVTNPTILANMLSDGTPQIYADLTSATGVAINTFRQAFMVQALLERDARGGTRYVELIRSHFGVTNPDFRLQRPEYIGGGSTPLTLTPVAQTAPSAGVPVGALGAAGTASGSHRASYAATEHGYILGLINVRTELSYQQGLHKMWTRQTRFDFYWPAFAGLGEQEILRKEIYCTGDATNDNTLFGFQERWHEYRTRTSEVTGILRSTHTGTLDAWHLAQRFTAPPTLSEAFIEENPPMARVLAAGALAVNQQYLADILIQRTAVRPIPMFGTPALLGRF